MIDFQTVKETLEQAQLSPTEWDQIQEMVIVHRQRAIPASVEAYMVQLYAATDHFWEGLTPEEVNDIVAAMTSEHIDPEDLQLMDRLDGLAKGRHDLPNG